MTVRDVRQRWPVAERALAEEGEVIVTRDGKPVARIVPFEPRRRTGGSSVDWDALDRWRARFWKRQPAQRSTDEDLANDRADRE
ncbi:MAG: type II toxin-antitoxin system prevent-host-death family antitoxin [Deltaproteobacteria bacterium]|nr:type II toxin-antitoxin system prevent-host-death family antitoxin [Deltaproteobacteria bacterium]